MLFEKGLFLGNAFSKCTRAEGLIRRVIYRGMVRVGYILVVMEAKMSLAQFV